MKTLTRLSLILIFLASFLSSCEKDDLQNPELEESSIELENFNSNYQKWKASGIKSYTMTESLGCFCLVRGEHDLNIVNNSITTIKNNQGMAVAINNSGLITINELFEFIEKSLGRNPATSRIKYDTTYGYPVDVYFDYDTRMADEERGYVLKNFIPTE